MLFAGIIVIVIAAILGAFAFKNRKRGITATPATEGSDWTILVSLVAAIGLVIGLTFLVIYWRTGPTEASQPERPTAAFVFEPNPDDPLKYTFDASASKASDGQSIAEYSWTWDTEGGAKGTYPSAEHRFAGPGSYTVTLSVRESAENNDGATDLVSQTVDIPDPAAASSSASATPTSSAAPATTAVPCAGTWQMVAQTPDNGNWVKDGVTEIRDAQTDADALNAANVWVDTVKVNPAMLGGAAAYLLGRQVDVATLQDANGCATPQAQALVNELKFAIANGKTTVSEAPADGINSGTNSGAVYASTGPGIDGDRKAIKITRADGTEVWIMWRCGNPVVLRGPPIPQSPLAPAPVPPAPPAEVPPGSTPPGSTPPETPKCPPDMPFGEYPLCKDGPSHDVLVNPDVPAQVKGPGTTPIGGDPGPASAPTDSPTGCPGTCQNPATASAPAANPAMTQPVLPSAPPQVQAPVTAVSTIPATAAVSGAAGGGCGVDAMGIPIDSC